MTRSGRGSTGSHGAGIALATATAVVALAMGCNAVLGLDEKQLAQPGPDSGVDLESDAAADSLEEQPPSACPTDDSGYGELTAASCWTTFDTKKVNAGAGAVEGITFDGRYMYFAPNPGSIVLRYDTTGPFDDIAAWSSFDLTASLGLARAPQLSGAVFDGRFVTFVPNDVNPDVVMYDTTAPFQGATSWSTYDPTPASAKAKGFKGATFDGQYVYFVPNENGVVLRHDTRAPPGPAGWSTFDLAAVQPGGTNDFSGGGFDGRYLYLSPATDGVVMRYDVQASFSMRPSWTVFDTAALKGGGLFLFGAAFTGRYVYFGPGSAGETGARYDTQGPLSAAASWSTFDLNELSATFSFSYGAAFDGRYLYYPSSGQVNFQVSTVMARHDTLMPFDRASSWSKFDLAKVGAAGVGSAAFDGKYIYFAPDATATITRFEARSTSKPLTLPAFHGSFY